MASTASTTGVATRRRSPKRIIKTSPVRRALRGPSLHLLVIPATAPAAGTMTPVDLLRRVDSMPVDMDRRAGAAPPAAEIGRAACRERGCQYDSIWVVAGK